MEQLKRSAVQKALQAVGYSRHGKPVFSERHGHAFGPYHIVREIIRVFSCGSGRDDAGIGLFVHYPGVIIHSAHHAVYRGIEGVYELCVYRECLIVCHFITLSLLLGSRGRRGFSGMSPVGDIVARINCYTPDYINEIAEETPDQHGPENVSLGKHGKDEVE